VTERGLSVAQYLALQATADGKVYRTHTGTVYTLVGPCSSRSLWVLARAEFIVDPPDAKQHHRYPMILSEKGRAALAALATKKKRRHRKFGSPGRSPCA
jgi:hypothetical protein